MIKYSVACFILDDDSDDIDSMKKAFEKEGDIDARFFTNPDEFEAVLTEDSWVTVIDFVLPKTDGQKVLNSFLKKNPEGHAILISGLITPELAVRLSYAGAKDCIEKRKNWEQWLAVSIKKHIELVQDKIEAREQKRKEHNEVKKLIGRA